MHQKSISNTPTRILNPTQTNLVIIHLVSELRGRVGQPVNHTAYGLLRIILNMAHVSLHDVQAKVPHHLVGGGRVGGGWLVVDSGWVSGE